MFRTEMVLKTETIKENSRGYDTLAFGEILEIPTDECTSAFDYVKKCFIEWQVVQIWYGSSKSFWGKDFAKGKD